eukprot:TRINITY_DN15129_c0_g1_i1.p1 TRINITY_DN15129_c0_g1~~TRINITY_DN15129_c0_g1_i1.p1  ORF type:complete len:329 (-),score=45.09 TRINITY_DN15129_c0_g1_i1:185-1171(-)
MSSLRQTPLTCSGHTRPVVFLAFSSLNPDGQYYSISACKDGKPMLRQGETGDWIGTFEGHKGAVWGVDINKDASKAATGAADFSAKVWDASTGEEELSLQHKHIVKSVHFSSDGAALATGSNDKVLRIYDLEQPSEPIVKFQGHTAGIKQVSYTPDNTKLLSCSDDKTVRMWDSNTGNLIKKKDFNENIGGLEISADGETITVAVGRKVVFLNAQSMEVEKEVSVPCAVYSASLLKDKDIFVCGGEDLKLYKFDYNSGQEIENFKGHFGPVHCVRFSPDGELYASGSEDGTLRLWQTEVGKTYGLWKCVDSVSSAVEGLTIRPEAVAS